MPLEDEKAVVRRAVEAFNQRNLQQLEEFFAPDYVEHPLPPGQSPGLEGVRQRWSMFAAAFPDARITIEDLVAEGDKVAVRFTFDGTHQGELMGVPPVGKRVAVMGSDINRIKGGKIAERWGEFDMLSMLQQLGAIPTAG